MSTVTAESKSFMPSSGADGEVPKTKDNQFGLTLIEDDLLDCLDTDHNWLVAEVIRTSADAVFIHYLGWQPKYDEWIPRASPRLARFRQHTKGKERKVARSHPRRTTSKIGASKPQDIGQLDYQPLHSDFTDVVLKTKDGKELQFHKLLLLQNSPVLSEALKQDPRTKELPFDYSANSLILGLRLLEGSMQPDDLKSFADPGIVLELLHFSHAYDLKSLASACIKRLELVVNEDLQPLVETWERAKQYHYPGLELTCQTALLRRADEVMDLVEAELSPRSRDLFRLCATKFMRTSWSEG